VHCINSQTLTVVYRFHITCEVEKKIIQTDDKALQSAIVKHEFSINTSFTLQSWDSDFQDRVDVNDVADLADKCKLLVLVKGRHCTLFVMLIMQLCSSRCRQTVFSGWQGIILVPFSLNAITHSKGTTCTYQVAMPFYIQQPIMAW